MGGSERSERPVDIYLGDKVDLRSQLAGGAEAKPNCQWFCSLASASYFIWAPARANCSLASATLLKLANERSEWAFSCGFKGDISGIKAKYRALAVLKGQELVAS